MWQFITIDDDCTVLYNRLMSDNFPYILVTWLDVTSMDHALNLAAGFRFQAPSSSCFFFSLLKVFHYHQLV